MKATSAAISPSEPAPPQAPRDAFAPLARAQGELRLAFRRRGPDTVLDTLYQQGCAKARLPNAGPDGWKSAVAINTAGGLTGGDSLAVSVDWRDGARALVAGQAAEKIYRAASDVARVRTRLSVGAGAWAEYLPQETILFDAAALDRDTVVGLMPDSNFLGLESVVLGRQAMGESVRQGRLRDAWRVFRGGRLVYADAISAEGDIAARFARAAIGGGARAFATIVAAAPDIEALLAPVRQALAEGAHESEAGASCWDGLLVVRILAADGQRLQRLLPLALAPLRQGRALPRVWRC
ncbi:MAG: urease accessory protein UreD [Reyranellaceae bacterium]